MSLFESEQHGVPSSSWKYLLLCSILAFGFLLRTRRQRHLMPPGPAGLPFVGNFFQLHRQFLWMKLTELAEKYGPIYSLSVVRVPVLVISSKEIAAELLDRRAEKYSSRPRAVLGGELMSHDKFLLFTPFGPFYLAMRRIAQEFLTPRMSKDSRVVQEDEAARLTLNIMKSPADWMQEVKRTVISVSLRTLYGWPTVLDRTHPLLERIHQNNTQVDLSARPFSSFVDIFPWLSYLPKWMSTWRRLGDFWYHERADMYEGLLDDVRRHRAERQCFATGVLSKVDDKEISFSDAAWLTGTVLGGATATTITTLPSVILALALHPDVQLRAQAELDDVVGQDHVPTFEDMDNLPYIQAMVKEILRWGPVFPLGIAHATSEDDHYSGYLIPKGTFVIANTWAMHRDPDVYPDAETFRPERYFDERGKLASALPDTHGQGHLTYGFGKRLCVGMHVANQMLFIALARMLWALHIDKPTFLDGSPVVSRNSAYMDPDPKNQPRPFICRFRPRMSNAEALLELECAKQR